MGLTFSEFRQRPVAEPSEVCPIHRGDVRWGRASALDREQYEMQS